MVIVICEKTGIEFEAENRRRKSHPTVMSWLEKAYQEGWYDQANAALYGSRYTQKQTFTTIEQFVSYFQDLQKSATQSKRDIDAAENQRQRDVAEAKRQRYVTNSLLRGRGYSWSKFENDEEDIDMTGLPEVEWILYSPDHRPVSVKEAMLELAYYEDTKFAHEWLASRGITEEVPAIEMKRQEVAAKAEQVQTEEERREQERQEYRRNFKQTLLSHGISEQEAEVHAERISHPHTVAEDRVTLASTSLSDESEAEITIDSDTLYFLRIGDSTYTMAETAALYDFLTKHHDQIACYAQRMEARNAR